MEPPKVLLFDALGTCLSLETLRPRLSALGLPPETLELWFARSLRDAFALEATNSFQPLGGVLVATLTSLLEAQGNTAGFAEAQAVVRGLGELRPYPDVRPALEVASRAGLPVVLLTNGSEEPTEEALERAGLSPWVTRCISVEAVGHFKPSAEVYLHAARELSCAPAQAALVSAHPWDIHGAKRAGLSAGYVARVRGAYPPNLLQPDATESSLYDLIRALIAQGRSAQAAPPLQLM